MAVSNKESKLNQHLQRSSEVPLGSRGLRQLDMTTIGPLIGLFLIIIVFSILAESFLSVANILNILRQSAIIALWPLG